MWIGPRDRSMAIVREREEPASALRDNRRAGYLVEDLSGFPDHVAVSDLGDRLFSSRDGFDSLMLTGAYDGEALVPTSWLEDGGARSDLDQPKLSYGCPTRFASTPRSIVLGADGPQESSPPAAGARRMQLRPDSFAS